MNKRIAFQGEPGAYSHQACRETYHEMESMLCRTFEDAIDACDEGVAPAELREAHRAALAAVRESAAASREALDYRSQIQAARETRRAASATAQEAFRTGMETAKAELRAAFGA